MDQTAAIYPMIAMAFLTLAVALLMLALRFQAVRRDGLDPAYFLLNSGDTPPAYLTRINQHYDNLFESPVLFYVVCILVYITRHGDLLFVALAWLYIALRCLHAAVHISYNDLSHRRRVFLLGSVVLYSLWGRLLFQLLTAA